MKMKSVALVIFLLLGMLITYAYASIQGNYAFSVVDPSNTLQYHTCIGDNTNGLWVNIKTGTISSITNAVTVQQATATNLNMTAVQPTASQLNVTAVQSTASQLNVNVNMLTTISGSNACMNPTSTLASISGVTSGTAAVQIIAASGSTKIYICSMTIISSSGTTPTFSLVYGTGSNCGTGQNTLISAFATATTAGVL